MIAPIFYDYHLEIIKELENENWIVTFYDVRPSTNSFIKGFIKTNDQLKNHLMKEYVNQIIKDTANIVFDVVLIIDNIAFGKEEIIKIKNQHLQSRFILYMWDAIQNYPCNIGTFQYYDKILSFDIQDCKEYGFELLPLFFTESYEEMGRKQGKTVFDLVSICTAHPIRYPMIKSLETYCQNEGIRFYSYLYLQSIILYMYYKRKERVFKNSQLSEFHFKPLNTIETRKIIASSKVVFDICNKNQNGLTMRSIEAIGGKKKLITTNKTIIDYDFFDQNNILVINETDDFHKINSFMRLKYINYPKELYQKYSLRNWIKQVLI